MGWKQVWQKCEENHCSTCLQSISWNDPSQCVQCILYNTTYRVFLVEGSFVEYYAKDII